MRDEKSQKTIFLIIRLGFSLISCSQNRNTFQSLRTSCFLTSRSRFWLLAIFVSQYLAFVLGFVLHLEHPCQKHPSIKIATLLFGKIKSGVPKRRWLCLRQPIILFVRRSFEKATSVVWLPLLRIAAIFRLLCSFVILSINSIPRHRQNPHRWLFLRCH